MENLSWETIIERYDRPHTLFYLDPPYWQTEGYGVDFGFHHYQRMADLARSIQGSMLISINDHPDIRQAFSGLHLETIGIRYTVGGGEGSDAQELLLWNDNCQAKRAGARPMELFDDYTGFK